MTSHMLFLSHSAPGSSLVKKKKIQKYFTKKLEPELQISNKAAVSLPEYSIKDYKTSVHSSMKSSENALALPTMSPHRVQSHETCLLSPPPLAHILFISNLLPNGFCLFYPAFLLRPTVTPRSWRNLCSSVISLDFSAPDGKGIWNSLSLGVSRGRVCFQNLFMTLWELLLHWDTEGRTSSRVSPQSFSSSRLHADDFIHFRLPLLPDANVSRSLF